MKQILQSLKDGAVVVESVPAPQVNEGRVLIETTVSLLSAGTERMLLEFGQGNWFQKAKSQPDKVRQVIEKAKSDGPASALEAVMSKLDQPVKLGYCNVGKVLDGGNGGFKPGDRVVSNGSHAGCVSVPHNLCARIPDVVTDEQASFVVLAAIGLQGIRLANPTLGERVVVIGLGLIGLLTVQLLQAQGCRVLGIDVDPRRLAVAKRFGADVVDLSAGEDPIGAAELFSMGDGVDAVLVTASTPSSEPISQAATMCRKRGRIVLVGVTGLSLNRSDFYEKEISLQVSCSYGPGRYDPHYEEQGHDYPLGFVRWTENRNFIAVLELMASGKLDVMPLISHQFSIDEGEKAVALLTSDEASLGVILRYPPYSALDSAVVQISESCATLRQPMSGCVAFIGAGNYAGRTLIPAFRLASATMHTLVSEGGVSAIHYAKKYGFEAAATDVKAALAEPVDTVVIATRHDTHAELVMNALRAGKHVYCEKPLCLNHTELSEIEVTARENPELGLIVGFNRRYAPLVKTMAGLLKPVPGPKSVVMTINAGAIPADHWTQNPAVGGGRIIGEACHFIDLSRFLIGSPISHASIISQGCSGGGAIMQDKAIISLSFMDGSIASIQYLADGHRGFPKERIEVFAGGKVLQLNNFMSLKGWGWRGFSVARKLRQDKGVNALVAETLKAVRIGGAMPIPLDEILEVSRVSIQLAEEASA